MSGGRCAAKQSACRELARHIAGALGLGEASPEHAECYFYSSIDAEIEALAAAAHAGPEHVAPDELSTAIRSLSARLHHGRKVFALLHEASEQGAVEQ